MARSGSNRARHIARRGVDLTARALSDEQAQEAQEVLELAQGMRCNGCGRRVRVGVQFMSIDPRDGERPTATLVACSRDDCDFMEQCKDGATVMKMVEYVWLDANGPNAPAARVVVRRNEQNAARERDSSVGESNGGPRLGASQAEGEHAADGGGG